MVLQQQAAAVDCVNLRCHQLVCCRLRVVQAHYPATVVTAASSSKRKSTQSGINSSNRLCCFESRETPAAMDALPTVRGHYDKTNLCSNSTLL